MSVHPNLMFGFGMKQVEADQFVTDGHFWKHERKTAY